MVAGLIVGGWLLPGPRYVGRTCIDVHTLLYATVMILIGFQAISFAIFSKILGITSGILPSDERFENLFKYITLEVGIATGGILVLLGLGGTLHAINFWAEQSFGPLNYQKTLRVVIPSMLSLTLGCQIVFSSFFLSMLGMRRQ
jgi:hypothetical protein